MEGASGQYTPAGEEPGAGAPGLRLSSPSFPRAAPALPALTSACAPRPSPASGSLPSGRCALGAPLPAFLGLDRPPQEGSGPLPRVGVAVMKNQSS